MIAAGTSLTVGELIAEIASGCSAPVLNHSVFVMDSDGHRFEISRAEGTTAGVELTVGHDFGSLVERIAELEGVMNKIADSNEKGCRLTKAEIVELAQNA